jgi:hypothetical protein
VFLTHFKYRKNVCRMPKSWVAFVKVFPPMAVRVSSERSCKMAPQVFLPESLIYKMNLVRTFYSLLMFYHAGSEHYLCTLHFLKHRQSFFMSPEGERQRETNFVQNSNFFFRGKESVI